jgi:ATP-dependent DNA ligase
LHEIKHDGYRLMALREGARVRLFTRNGHDWADRYPVIVEAVGALNVNSCLIDGEVIVPDASGLARFDLLRSRRHEAEAILCAFDLIAVDGNDLRREPIETRRHRLERMVRRPLAGLLINEQYQTEGAIVYYRACQLGCEGIVSKRRGSAYRSGKSFDWIKSKDPKSPAKQREEIEDWQ